MTEQSGIQAGDEGFQVAVQGSTDLKGAVIASTEKAVQDGKNSFDTASLSMSDIQNKANYKASSISTGIGSAMGKGGKLGQIGTGAGIGKDSDSASSVTQSGISDIAGNKGVRTGDVETGINQIFDADKVQKEIAAQTQITKAFSENANAVLKMYTKQKREAMLEKYKDDKAALKEALGTLKNEERILNILVGAVTGQGVSAVTKESLAMAADEMRRLTIENSSEFKGITDGSTTVSNTSGESEGVDGDGKKPVVHASIWILYVAQITSVVKLIRMAASC